MSDEEPRVEPLEYHQPSHPDVVDPKNAKNWRQPLLPESECDHERTFTDLVQGTQGEVEMSQCLDCAAVTHVED